MRTINLISIILMFAILNACNKSSELLMEDDIHEHNEGEQTDGIEENSETEDFDEDYTFDCTFVQDDETADGWFNETESSIIVDCNKNQLTTIDEIKENLIGEWELIGHAVGWARPISLPCAHVKITENELVLTFNNGNINAVTNHTWSIVEGIRYGKKILELNVEPKAADRLSIHSFCKYYMYLDYTPQDANMYLYQKMK